MELDKALRKRAGEMGVSLNSLICGVLMGEDYGPREVVRTERAAEVPRVRSGIRNQRRGKRATAIQQSRNNPPTDRGTVEKSLRNDPVEPTKEIRGGPVGYQGPPHAKSCDCTVCMLKKGKR